MIFVVPLNRLIDQRFDEKSSESSSIFVGHLLFDGSEARETEHHSDDEMNQRKEESHSNKIVDSILSPIDSIPLKYINNVNMKRCNEVFLKRSHLQSFSFLFKG